MYRVEYTLNAHVSVPEHCWLDGGEYATREEAENVRQARHINTGQAGCWANHTRVIDTAGG